MIIKTPQSHLAHTVDTTLTGLGWLIFFYLFTHGVFSLLEPMYFGTGALEPLMPTISSLMVYLSVSLFNAAALVLWARYHKAIFRTLRDNVIPLTEASVSSQRFQLQPDQLHDVQDSRVTVIYHADDGDISHLETDRLKIYLLNPKSSVLRKKAA